MQSISIGAHREGVSQNLKTLLSVHKSLFNFDKSYSLGCILSKITKISFAKKGSTPPSSRPRTTKNSLKAGFESGLFHTEKDQKKDLRKRIKEAEDQLLKTVLEPSIEEPVDSQTVKTLDFDASNKDPEQLNLQPKENIASNKMTEKRIVAPGSKDAPRFKSSQPEELRRFIRRMEDIWTDAGVAKDEEKKLMIGKYADRDSEEEWCAFDSFTDGTWEEFKEELIANYPEAAAAERGTPARIRQICAETSKVRLGDMPALYRFRRAFMAEAKKLRKAPAAMANRELVELFIGCLSEALASAVLQFLGNRASSSKDKDEPDKGKSVEGQAAVQSGGSPKGKLPRRPEDRYDLDDICKAAIQVSENSQGMFNLMGKESSSSSDERDVFVFSQPVSESKVLTAKVEELEGIQANERDRLASMNKTMESKMNGLEELLKAFIAHQNHVCKGDCKNTNCKSHENNNGPTQKWSGRSMENERCFWCGLLGHFQADCEDQKNQIRMGNIKVNPEGKLRLRDGSFIPNFPAGATLKERVERHYSKKPSQFYYGEYEENDPPQAAGVLSQLFGTTTSDADKRTLAQIKAELDLRKREEALELKQKVLEQNEKKLEQTSGSTRTTNVLELLEQLTDEELAVIRAAKSGFN